MRPNDGPQLHTHVVGQMKDPSAYLFLSVLQMMVLHYLILLSCWFKSSQNQGSQRPERLRSF